MKKIISLFLVLTTVFLFAGCSGSANDADVKGEGVMTYAEYIAADLSWNEQGEDAVRKYKKGDELEAVVLGIDTERERISLGIKQLSGDPFTDFAGSHERNTIVKGTVKSVDAKGAVIDLGNDTEGYLRASEISSPCTMGMRAAGKR